MPCGTYILVTIRERQQQTKAVKYKVNTDMYVENNKLREIGSVIFIL